MVYTIPTSEFRLPNESCMDLNRTKNSALISKWQYYNIITQLFTGTVHCMYSTVHSINFGRDVSSRHFGTVGFLF